MISDGPSVLRLAAFVNGNPFKPSDLGDQGLPVIRIRQLLDVEAPIEYAVPPARPVLIDKGDLIFSWSATLAVRHWYGDRALLNQHLFRVDPVAGIDRRWMGYVLRVGIERLKPLMHGSAMTHITLDMLRRLSVSVPDVHRQVAIADYLDTETARIDTLISKKRRLIELLAERRTLAAEDALARLRESETSIPLKYLVNESNLRCGTNQESGLLSVSIHQGVVPKSLESSNQAVSEDLTTYKLCHPGDVVVNRMRAFQGGLGVSPQKGIVSPDYTVLRVGTKVSPKYLHFLMRSSWFVSEMTRRLRGIGATDQGQVRTPRINFADMGLIEVPVPSRDRQDELASDLTRQEAQLTQLVDLQKKQLALLAEQRQALITTAVTGEIKVLPC